MMEQQPKLSQEKSPASVHHYAAQAQQELIHAKDLLDIQGVELPRQVKVSMTDDSELAKVSVHGEKPDINLNREFFSQTKLSEDEKAERVKMVKHEFAHIAMWSVTGMDRQPATRLLDEGWAELVAHLGSKATPDIDAVAKRAKSEIQEIKRDNPKAYEKCLDFNRGLRDEDQLNAAEYEIGQALLLYVREQHGQEKMIELLKKAPGAARRNNDLPDDAPEPALVSADLHSEAASYRQLLEAAQSGQLKGEELDEAARNWEGKQLQAAMREVTGIEDVVKIKEEFEKWLNTPELATVEDLKSACDNPEFQRLLPSYVEYLNNEKIAEKPYIHGTGSYALKRIIESGFVPQSGAEAVAGENVASRTRTGQKANPICFTIPENGGEKVSHYYAMAAATEPDLTVDSDQILGVGRAERLAQDVYGGIETTARARFAEELKRPEVRKHYQSPDNPGELDQAKVKAGIAECVREIEYKKEDRMRRAANVFNLEHLQKQAEQLNGLLEGTLTDAAQAEKILRESRLFETARYRYAPRGEQVPRYESDKLVRQIIDEARDSSKMPKDKDDWTPRGAVLEAIKENQNKIELFNSKSPEEQQEILHQFPCYIVVEGDDLAVTESGWLGPNVKELQSYDVVSRDRIREIQVPEAKIPEVEKWLQDDEGKRKPGLENVRVVPFEYFEMKEVIEKASVK